MTRRLFGTDGIRARFGEEPLVEPTVRRIGLAIGRHLAAARGDSPRVLLAGDTRSSTPVLTDWLASGLDAADARPIDLGMLPTAAIARLVVDRGAAAGISISASHNPAEDNGIKLVGADGFKASIEEETEIEEEIADTRDPGPRSEARGEIDPSAREDYRTALLRELRQKSPFSGMTLALDAANGAATGLTDLFELLGARTEVSFDRPDGTNINRDCGATRPEVLAGRMGSGGFDLGFAFDGDADRAILIDERGGVRDGDAMLLLWARDLHAAGDLEPAAIVATSMSNLGLERALARDGIEVVRCGVGDREVVRTLRDRGLRLGGEQSGHLVDLARTTTGDGLLTALLITDLVVRAGRPVSELLVDFHRYPQRIVNVPVRARPDLSTLPRVAAAARSAQERLAGDGRLVLRYSGTEPLARVMIEAPDEQTVETLSAEIAAAIRDEIGGP